MRSGYQTPILPELITAEEILVLPRISSARIRVWEAMLFHVFPMVVLAEMDDGVDWLAP